MLLAILPLFSGCTTSGYLNAVNPYNLFMGMSRYTPFRKSAFRTSYSNVSWEQKIFAEADEKYTTASCEDNYMEFTKLPFIRSITGLVRYDIGKVYPLERTNTNICRFYAVLTIHIPDAGLGRSAHESESYFYFYWRERGDRLIVFGDYNRPWQDVYAKDTLEEFLKR